MKVIKQGIIETCSSTSKENKQQNQKPEGNHSNSGIVELDYLLQSSRESYPSLLPLSLTNSTLSSRPDVTATPTGELVFIIFLL